MKKTKKKEIKGKKKKEKKGRKKLGISGWVRIYGHGSGQRPRLPEGKKSRFFPN